MKHRLTFADNYSRYMARGGVGKRSVSVYITVYYIVESAMSTLLVILRPEFWAAGLTEMNILT